MRVTVKVLEEEAEFLLERLRKNGKAKDAYGRDFTACVISEFNGFKRCDARVKGAGILPLSPLLTNRELLLWFPSFNGRSYETVE